MRGLPVFPTHTEDEGLKHLASVQGRSWSCGAMERKHGHCFEDSCPHRWEPCRDEIAFLVHPLLPSAYTMLACLWHSRGLACLLVLCRKVPLSEGRVEEGELQVSAVKSSFLTLPLDHNTTLALAVTILALTSVLVCCKGLYIVHRITLMLLVVQSCSAPVLLRSVGTTAGSLMERAALPSFLRSAVF